MREEKEIDLGIGCSRTYTVKRATRSDEDLRPTRVGVKVNLVEKSLVLDFGRGYRAVIEEDDLSSMIFKMSECLHILRHREEILDYEDGTVFDGNFKEIEN